MTPLPPIAPWPTELGGYSTENDRTEYALALATAWESRCRVAVEALVQLHERAESFSDDEAIAWDAMHAIGPLPPLPALPTMTEGE